MKHIIKFPRVSLFRYGATIVDHLTIENCLIDITNQCIWTSDQGAIHKAFDLCGIDPDEYFVEAGNPSEYRALKARLEAEAAPAIEVELVGEPA
jgi:hypothetical protein